jgi:MHS family alpha-ketoglutarate permease-like MFS transporter
MRSQQDSTAREGFRQGIDRARSIFAGCAGNLVEWYDWYIYSAFSLYFAKSFFPNGDQTAQLLSAAAIFAVGFLMRPLGAWIMGRYADTAGRRAALTLSVAMMCAGSMIIAFIPNYQSIGVLAPIALTLARMLQGLSLGGEYGASAAYLTEMANRGRRGFWSSFQYVTLIMGQLIALAVLLLLQRLMSGEALAAWGWRIPFFIGGGLSIAVFWLRRNMSETASFTEAKSRAKPGGSLELVLKHPRETLTVLGLTAGGTVAFYTYTTYVQKFLVNTTGLTTVASTWVTASALFIYMLLQPLAGLLSDRVGRKPLLIGFGVLGLCLTWPIMTSLEAARSPLVAFCLLLAALVIVTGYTAINAVVKAELFPTEMRALGVALPYAVANSVFGGTAEYVALALKTAGREHWFYLYVSLLIGLSLFVYLFMPESSRRDRVFRGGEDPEGNPNAPENPPRFGDHSRGWRGQRGGTPAE